ncbi:Bowman-Birk type proteinase inhibitor [Cajanus cajan]|uniref:Seed trypsin/chymotrypsin inhibitor TI5-72 n=1 Tax=Cajanus cajan TaxID=3821 RepID=A0A151TBK5_CAJCA|nr:Bowman-Birk type proteinase inhibitor [Cajanus cajan]KYP64427.1 Seed trypsin/chymotrypsin inhibitor TI5-72 [Cajanus cajan]
MELKKVVLVKAALLLFFICFTASVDARFDPGSFITQVFSNGDAIYNVKSTTTACCDKCFCTKSNPPQCQCNDVGETCHTACKLCVCALSYPPQCRCMDNTSFCYDKCDTSKPKAH